MFTRRELFCLLIGAGLSAGAFALADHTPILGSTAIDWNSVPAKPTATGSVRHFLDSRTATLDELEVHVTTLNPGQSPHPPHTHAHEELLVIDKGEVEAFINNGWTRVGPGSVIFFASNQLHGLRNSGSVPAMYHVIAIHAAGHPDAPKARPVNTAPHA